MMVAIICLIIGFNPVLVITELPFAWAFLREVFPPNFNFLFHNPHVLESAISTIAMAFLGTAAGGIIALFLAFLAARNIVPQKILNGLIHSVFAIERVIPSFIILLFFLILAGIGPFAGTLALSITTIGTFGKLFAESMEQVDNAVLQGVEATGGSRLQIIWFALLPEASPTIISHFFYAFDVNIRRAIGLGIFGGGGLGFDLYIAMGMMEYSSAVALMLVIVALIFSSERISNYLRNRVMRNG
jgi:phosphonate transport system permease protein